MTYDETVTIEQATAYLRELLSYFPFSDWRMEPHKMPIVENGVMTFVEPSDNDGVEPAMVRQSRSQAVQIAAMLSQFAGGCVGRNSLRLGFCYTANAVRSGKTLLVKLAVIPVHGRMATQTYNPRDEELRKVLLAEVLRASTYIVFDNVKGFVGSQVVEAFMTSTVWTDRGLGGSKMFEANNDAVVFFTGNEGTVSPDIKNRCLEVHLFVAEADVQDRVVTNEIDDAWLMDLENRRRILSALWAIVRHWDAAGRPIAQGLRVRKGFERWCRVIGSMVAAAGFGDCLEKPAEGEGILDEESEIRALVRALHEYFKADQTEISFAFAEIVSECHERGLFEWIIADGKWLEDEGIKRWVLKPEANSRLGKLLRRYAPLKDARLFTLRPGVVVYFSCTGKDRHRAYWLKR